MNKTILTITLGIVLMLSVFGLHAQTTVSYTYDAAGNRLTRSTEVRLRTAEAAKSASETDEEEIKTNTTQNFAVTVYPNPVRSLLTVQITGNADITEHHVILTELNGRTIYQTVETSNEFSLDMQRFSGGTYFLSIRSGNEKSQFTIIKEN